jgi:hypothetical protein
LPALAAGGGLGQARKAAPTPAPARSKGGHVGPPRSGERPRAQGIRAPCEALRRPLQRRWALARASPHAARAGGTPTRLRGPRARPLGPPSAPRAAPFASGTRRVGPGCAWVAPALAWVAPGLRLGCAWVVPGLRLGCAWVVPGLRLGCAWVAAESRPGGAQAPGAGRNCPSPIENPVLRPHGAGWRAHGPCSGGLVTWFAYSQESAYSRSTPQGFPTWRPPRDRTTICPPGWIQPVPVRHTKLPPRTTPLLHGRA